jgi:hypothetical protein
VGSYKPFNLTVYAFSDKAQTFKDEVICLLKDNPNPVIFSVQSLGTKSVVKVDQEIVEFDRLLLDKKLTKTLTLGNICAIPVKWNMKGIAELPPRSLRCPKQTEPQSLARSHPRQRRSRILPLKSFSKSKTLKATTLDKTTRLSSSD